VKAIRQSSAAQRRAFVLACANVSVEHCAYAVLDLDDRAKGTLATLRDQTLGAVNRAEAEAVDGVLARREDELYDALCALRRDDAVSPYATFLRLATQRHTIRALRATLVADGLTAAARAAFEAISATRNEDTIVSLAHHAMALEG
jgi:hypothetical protein